MTWTRRPSRRPRRRQITARLGVEALECRNLLAAPTVTGSVPTVLEHEPNDVASQAQDLGVLGGSVPAAAATGVVGNGPAGAADVDWYSFTLTAASRVRVATLDSQTGSHLVSVLSLYNSDPYNFDPPYGTPANYRLLAQNQGNALDLDATVETDLAAGTYYVAVSGAGNRYFHPLLADSGSTGSTGPYTLQVTASDLGLDPAGGPVILGGDPAPGGAIDHSPLVIRVDFSAAPNPDSIHINQAPNTLPIDPNDPLAFDPFGNPQPVAPSVWLTYNPTGNFGDGNDQPVLLAGGAVSTSANELRLSPASPLLPGYYQLFLAGDSSQQAFWVSDQNGNPQGADATHPAGQDLTFTFQVTGVKGNVGPAAGDNGTPATAKELGDVTQLVQVQGTIGDDPSFAGPLAGGEVDLYHFRVTGPGRYALAADAFAGRIGSPLDVGLSLFELDPTDGQTLDLIQANDNTLNGTTGPGLFIPPLFTDASVYAGLTAGDYYLAVSSSGNVPDPAEGLAPGVNGVFDLNAGTPYSGPPGLSTGDYVLSVLLQPAPQPPHVTAVTPAEGSVLSAPPTHLLVAFDVPVNLQQLGYQAFQNWQTTLQGDPGQLAAVYVLAPDGAIYHPRLVSYDAATHQADFLMLDALPNGDNQLHLSGAAGLTDLAGNPLVGNDASGDYVTHLIVRGPARGTPGDPLFWLDQEPNDSLDHPQGLGTLFGDDLTQSHQVTVEHDFAGSPGGAAADAEDDFRIQVLQKQRYVFDLVASGLPFGLRPQVYRGQTLLTSSPQGKTENTSAAILDPGTYVIQVKDLPATVGKYDLSISAQKLPENATPLTVGPEPTFRIRLATAAPTPSPGPETVGRLNLPSSAATGSPPVAGSGATGGPPVTPRVPSSAGPATAPPDGLLALAAGPVGGATAVPRADVASAPERLLVNGPSLVARERLLQVAVLTGFENVGGGDAGADPTAPSDVGPWMRGPLKEYVLRAVRAWQEVLDSVFGSDVNGEEDPAPDVAPGDAPQNGPDDRQPAPADDPDQVQLVPLPDAPTAPRPAGLALAGLLAAGLVGTRNQGSGVSSQVSGSRDRKRLRSPGLALDP